MATTRGRVLLYGGSTGEGGGSDEVRSERRDEGISSENRVTSTQQTEREGAAEAGLVPGGVVTAAVVALRVLDGQGRVRFHQLTEELREDRVRIVGDDTNLFVLATLRVARHIKLFVVRQPSNQPTDYADNLPASYHGPSDRRADTARRRLAIHANQLPRPSTSGTRGCGFPVGTPGS